jgi:SPP1 family predicted phage head-tail adaptor
MRAGKLTSLIKIQRVAILPNEFGTPSETWANHKRLRAEVIQQSAEEFVNSQGAVDRETIVFRTRYAQDVTAADRVLYRGEHHNIKGLTEIGRRKGLEIRCQRVD